MGVTDSAGSTTCTRPIPTPGQIDIPYKTTSPQRLRRSMAVTFGVIVSPFHLCSSPTSYATEFAVQDCPDFLGRLNTCCGDDSLAVLEIDSEGQTHKPRAFRQSPDIVGSRPVEILIEKGDVRVFPAQIFHDRVDRKTHGAHSPAADHYVLIHIRRDRDQTIGHIVPLLFQTRSYSYASFLPASAYGPQAGSPRLGSQSVVAAINAIVTNAIPIKTSAV